MLATATLGCARRQQTQQHTKCQPYQRQCQHSRSGSRRRHGGGQLSTRVVPYCPCCRLPTSSSVMPSGPMAGHWWLGRWRCRRARSLWMQWGSSSSVGRSTAGMCCSRLQSRQHTSCTPGSSGRSSRTSRCTRSSARSCWSVPQASLPATQISRPAAAGRRPSSGKAAHSPSRAYPW